MSSGIHPAEEITQRLSPAPLPFPTNAGGTPNDATKPSQRPRLPAKSLELPSIRGYELVSQLGRGGMGVVYLAVQQNLRRNVAIKMLPPEEPADSLDVARFFSEAEAVAAIKHPHIVQIYEFAMYDSHPYMAMEYLSGGSLAAKLLRREQLMTPDEAATLLEKLARAVQAAHEQGIVHRDLKPGNVLFDEAGEPRVTDFGLAKRATSNLTQTMEVMGTPAYMAPEQASGRTKYAGPAADIYALGAILYECLTGSAPFEQVEKDPWPILHRVIHDPPTKPSQLANVPIDLELICLKCLEKSPTDRYPTAAALADDLSRFLNRQPVSVRPPSSLERLVKWARRRPTAATAYALTVVVIGMLGVGAVIVSLWMKALDSKEQTESANRNLENQMELTTEARNNALQSATDAKAAQRQVEIREDQLKIKKGELEKALLGETTAKHDLQKTQQELLRTKYYHDVSLAYREYAEGNIAQADRLLNQCPKGLRGWEWWHCHSVVHPELATFTIPNCLDLTFSPNGDQLVVCTTESRIEYRNPDSGVLLKRVIIPAPAGLRRWLSGNGQRLLAATWDSKYNREPLPKDLSKVGVASVWDPATGKPLARWKDLNGMFFFCSVSADGSTAVITGDQESSRAQAYDLKTGNLIAELPDQLSSARESSITADGRLALSTTMDKDRFVSQTIWETKTGKIVQRLDHIHNQSFVWMIQTKLSPDGSHVVFLSNTGDLGFWKVGERAAFRYLIGTHTGNDFQIAFSPDGSLCATAGSEGGIRVWKTSTGEPLGVFHGHRGKIHRLVFHPAQDRLLSIDAQGHCIIWRITGNQAVNQFAPPRPWQVPVAVNERGDKMYVPYIFPNQTDALLFHREGQKQILIPRRDYVTDYVFQPGGNLLAIVTVNNKAKAIELRDATSGELKRKIDLPGGTAVNLMFSSDGTRLMAALSQHSLMAWEVDSGKEIFKAPWSFFGKGAISGDGKRIACGSVEGFASVYDVEKGQKICDLKLPIITPVTCIALNHDGSQVAIGSKDWKIHLFDLPANVVGPPLKLNVFTDLTSHSAPVQCLVFSPKGDRLVSGSDDGSVKVWDPHARLEAIGLKMTNKVPVQRVLFSQDGTRIIAIGSHGGATIFSSK